MKTTTVTEAKAQLSRLLRVVQQGESVLILSRGRAVARLVPVGPQATVSRLAHLARRGIVQRRRGTLDPSLLDPLPTPSGREPSLLSALLAQREDGR